MSTAVRRRALVAAAVLAASAGIALPAPPAGAAASCSFDLATGTMTVSLPEALDVVPIFTQANGDLSFDFRLCSDGATPATVTNTDLIVATGGDGRQELTIDVADGPLGPGATDEPGDSDEIEVQVDLGPGVDDRVIIYGSYDNEHFTASDAGLNLNADEADGADVDITMAGVEILDVFASRGDDVIDATGYPQAVNIYAQAGFDTIYGGLGGPAVGLSKLDGGTEDDVIHGGPGADDINGFYGTDVCNGNGGDDMFETGANADGRDTLRGGDGHDIVTYLPRTLGVTVTLDGRANDGEAGEKDNVGGDIEDVTGSKGNDRLTGNGKANELRGLDGNDTLNGGKGNDRLEGDEGDDDLTGGAGVDELYGHQDTDALHALDGRADLADGGTGTDTCDCDPNDIRRNLP
jgi:Ca2+-binding RTX toxin-like protein